MGAPVEAEADGSTPRRRRVRAAQYVRMSTEHQRYSIENQAAALADYALAHGMEIVRTYADEGKSGLTLRGRPSLRQLLADVIAGKAGFEALLVFDVSRWGRFQDADESAYYEYMCRQAGVRVIYCAEEFDNDGSAFANIVKSIKRTMAAEYSRELSAKIYMAKRRMVERGFHQGTRAGLGLRRVLIDQFGTRKCELKVGEHKYIHTDRIILAPGPPEEIELVLRMYRLYIEERLSWVQIADQLNSEGIPTDLGRLWNGETVRTVLTNEKYIGTGVFGRTSRKLKGKHVRYPPEQWLRVEGAFEGIVPRELFDEAQAITDAHLSRRWSDEKMLTALSALLARTGRLNSRVVDEAEGIPSADAYRWRFGSMGKTYSLIGYEPRSWTHVELKREVKAEVLAGLRAAGSAVRNLGKHTYMVDESWTFSIVLAHSKTLVCGRRWRVELNAHAKPTITLVARISPDNPPIRDYFILPLPARGRYFHLWEDDNRLEPFRVEDLSPWFANPLGFPAPATEGGPNCAAPSSADGQRDTAGRFRGLAKRSDSQPTTLQNAKL